ncbi:serpin B6-like isoform X1 [Neodiprion fabricii]|uniref:serpin B6-like isoform X1 n=1 Tax=Neodiprion fabricii TaxID=2872261 RepID=UPI001ED979BD|nr:serpin B6-like isoform X1 [Neodiprion fabricii]
MGEEIHDNNGLQAITEAANHFATSFLKVLVGDKSNNLIMSPLSVQVVLAMAAYGANGKTATQMRSALLLPDNDSLGQSGYRSLITLLNFMFQTAKGVELRLANKIFTASGFAVKSTYKELMTAKFLSSSQEVDFGDASTAAKTINTWCEEQTNNRIKDVITPNSICADTKLVLVNAVYFKGQWERKFDPSRTQDRPFYVDEKTTKHVPTMCIKHKFRMQALPELDASFIELPYQGGELSMIIILPNKIVNGLKTIEDNLHEVNLKERLQQISLRDVVVYLPKFKIECSLDLQNTLIKLGMTEMFTNGADFSGIAEFSLKVSKVVQKAFIEVNEEGTEAAAVTKMQITRRCGPREFEVNQPYYYAIYHRNTGISLFNGIVQQPN